MTTHVEPGLGTFFPCADTPTVIHGLVEIPELMVYWVRPPSLALKPENPFAALVELFELRVVLRAPGDIMFYEIHQDVDGAVLAHWMRSTTRAAFMSQD